MKKQTILLLLIFYKLSIAYGQQTPYWQQKVDYKIDVTLNDVDNTLDGYIKMDYFNNSPDTLYYIWFHLWPNAYKNDRTAFSDQLLENGNTDFYFSNKEKRGYINRLDFRVNNIIAITEDHPIHQDIIKLLLPQPLVPKSSCKIETPFHVKLPYNFSRGGHVDQSYQITQWYPKPAVYDTRGWHPIPYLDQGEFYSEFGNYTVQITLPENYIVAATGIQQEINNNKIIIKKNALAEDDKKSLKKNNNKPTAINNKTKTIHFAQNNVHDFAWF
ncbi:MAG: M1 family peptidase, partial [Ferruginibacter sp.]